MFMIHEIPVSPAEELPEGILDEVDFDALAEASDTRYDMASDELRAARSALQAAEQAGTATDYDRRAVGYLQWGLDRLVELRAPREPAATQPVENPHNQFESEALRRFNVSGIYVSPVRNDVITSTDIRRSH